MFRVNSYRANVKMIKFRTPMHPGRGGTKGAKFLVDDMAVGDIAAESPNSAR